MGETRVDVWIKSATSVYPFLNHIGKHMVAHPYGREEDAFGGQFITLTPDTETVGLRRYDTGEIRGFPWFTTNFKVTTRIENPFGGLAVGMVRRFEWFEDEDGHPVIVPRSLLGTVDKVTPQAVDLWVRDASYQAGGWWAHLKADDAAKHSIRPPVTPTSGE